MKNPNKKKYIVRFHLGKEKKAFEGENKIPKQQHFMQWRVEEVETGDVWFFDPMYTSLMLYGCFLRNQKGAAQKIHEGGDKTVCAWIECEGYVLTPRRKNKPNGEQVSYNPRKSPNWIYNDTNADYFCFDALFTWGMDVFTPLDPNKPQKAEEITVHEDGTRTHKHDKCENQIIINFDTTVKEEIESRIIKKVEPIFDEHPEINLIKFCQWGRYYWGDKCELVHSDVWESNDHISVETYTAIYEKYGGYMLEEILSDDIVEELYGKNDTGITVLYVEKTTKGLVVKTQRLY